MRKKYIQTIHVHVEAERNTNNVVEEGDLVVELEQLKYTLVTYAKPLIEVRDSL